MIRINHQMPRLRISSFGLLLIMAMLVNACSSTQLTAVWRDNNYRAHPVKFMVISVDRNPLTRRYFEDEFVERIKVHGVQAIASYSAISGGQQIDPDSISDMVDELGVDAVLITKLVSKTIAKGRVSGGGKWQDYYGYDQQSMYPPGVIAEDGYATIETRMFEAVHIKMVWSVSSRTAIGGAYEHLIDTYIDTILKTMVEQRLLVR